MSDYRTFCCSATRNRLFEFLHGFVESLKFSFCFLSQFLCNAGLSVTLVWNFLQLLLFMSFLVPVCTVAVEETGGGGGGGGGSNNGGYTTVRSVSTLFVVAGCSAEEGGR